MTTEDLESWATEFEQFHQRFAGFFCRSEPREDARQYLRGLLSPVRRKNAWQMAEALGETGPQGLQRLLHSARWDAEAVQAELQAFVMDAFGHPEGIGVLDESAFVKKGERSVGVKRQWCGTLGKTENCQVGVFLSYVSPAGKVFLDRRLYLPQEWAADPHRRQAARVPETVAFRTKGELGQEMLEAAWQRGVPMRWVTGDEAYGDLPYLRQRIAEQGLLYVLAVSANLHAWATRPAVEPPGAGPRGRPRAHPRLAPGAPPSAEVRQLVAAWPAAVWQQLSVGAGEKGPRVYDWAAARVVLRAGSLPGEEVWLLVRRPVTRPEELAYYLSNAPAETPLTQLAEVAGARWSIEGGFEEAKGETGLDEYEVRYWHSWHRHVTLSLLAHAFLSYTRLLARKREAEKKGRHGAEGGAGRVNGPGSAQAPGDRAAPAPQLPGSQAGVVPLAAGAASARAPEPLPRAAA